MVYIFLTLSKNLPCIQCKIHLALKNKLYNNLYHNIQHIQHMKKLYQLLLLNLHLLQQGKIMKGKNLHTILSGPTYLRRQESSQLLINKFIQIDKIQDCTFYNHYQVHYCKLNKRHDILCSIFIYHLLYTHYFYQLKFKQVSNLAQGLYKILYN